MNKINDDQVDFILTALGVRTEMGVEMVRAAMECVKLFDTKQQDYGIDNLIRGFENYMGIDPDPLLCAAHSCADCDLSAQSKNWNRRSCR